MELSQAFGQIIETACLRWIEITHERADELGGLSAHVRTCPLMVRHVVRHSSLLRGRSIYCPLSVLDRLGMACSWRMTWPDTCLIWPPGDRYNKMGPPHTHDQAVNVDPGAAMASARTGRLHEQ